jgi:hypothetical protein
MEKGQSFNRWSWEKWISTSQRIKLYGYLRPHLTVNPKWIKEFKTGMMKLLEENLRENCSKIRFSNDF